MFVRSLRARRIFATNSHPTIEVELRTAKGTVRAGVPMGTSRGKREVVYLPVNDALSKFSIISRTFRTDHFYTQAEVDDTLRKLDHTPKFRDIGGNLAIGISSAFLKAFALEADMEVFEYVYTLMYNEMDAKGKGKPPADFKKDLSFLPPDKRKEEVEKIENEIDRKLRMPMPLCNMAGGWKGQSDIQEYLMLPVHQASFSDVISEMSQAYLAVGDALAKADVTFSYGRNLESAWLTELGIEKILAIMSAESNRRLFRLGLDMASSNLWDGKYFDYKGTGEHLLRTQQMELVEDLLKRYPISYLEDPFEESDMVMHGTLTRRVEGKHVLVCGDDLYATDPLVLQAGIDNKATNCALVKPNQVGTITDTLRFVQLAKKGGMKTVMSHRSGETEDTLMCHLAVGMGCDYVKLGISGERTAKINELIRIEERLTDAKVL
jgi:enolase